jgi:hypothetical protein
MTSMLERIKIDMKPVKITKAYISLLRSIGQTMLHSPHDQTPSLQHKATRPGDQVIHPTNQHNIVAKKIVCTVQPRACVGGNFFGIPLAEFAAAPENLD